MISSKSDYKYVTGLDDILIDGQILPLRNDAADKTPLRGEDIAFLIEAATERSVLNVWNEYQFSKIISAMHPYIAWYRMNFCFTSANKNYFPTGGYREKELTQEENTPQKAFPELFNLTQSLSEDEARAAFASGVKVAREPIAKMFEDVAKVKYCAYAGGAVTFENDSTVITGEPPGNPPVLKNGNLYQEAYSAWKNDEEEIVINYDYIAKNPTEILVLQPNTPGFDRIDGILSAWVKMDMGYYLNNGTGESISESKTILFEVPARIENNKVYAETSALTNRIPQLFSKYFGHGMVRPEPGEFAVSEGRYAQIDGWVPNKLWPIYTIGSRTRW